MTADTLNQSSALFDRLILAILLPLRASKTLNHDALQEFENALDELDKLLSAETTVPKTLPGNLYFLFMSMLTEAQYAGDDDRETIESAAWVIGEKLERIFRSRYD